MLKKLLSPLEVGIARLLGWVRLQYYRRRLGSVLKCLKHEGDFIGPACPHEVRIPLEIVRRLSDHERRMLDNALLASARPYGAVLHDCRRCYSRTRSTIHKNYLGY